MRKRRISPELLDLLMSGQCQDFTVTDLKAAYMALPHCPHSSDKAAWQFVYRNISRMLKRGLISPVDGHEGAKTQYRWHAERPADIGSHGPTDIGPADATLSSLKEKLHRYKVELLTAIGETEEYDAICADMPHMHQAVQELYNQARDRCSKTLGRVRALESVLSNQSQWQQQL